MSLPRIEEVIVVEGKNDTQAILRVVEADTIETNGSAISERVLGEIERAWKKRGVIVFTDPDSAGERIRRIITERVPGVKHAFLSREQAKNDSEIGIEHASADAILKALNQSRASVRIDKNDCIKYPISWNDYMIQGFVGKSYSSKFREMVADQLGIGYGNAKTFYHRLGMLQVSPEELREAIEKVRRRLN